MQKFPADRADSAGTQGQPYTAAELVVIEQLAREGYTLPLLAEHFPNRSAAGVKKRIIDMRHKLGLVRERVSTESKASQGREPRGLDPDDPGCDDGWFPQHCADTARGSNALLAALMRAA